MEICWDVKFVERYISNTKRRIETKEKSTFLKEIFISYYTGKEKVEAKKKDGEPIFNHPNTRKVCITTYWVWP